VNHDYINAEPINASSNACETCLNSDDSTDNFPSPITSSPHDLSRRSFLQLLAAGAGVAFLHGCAGSDASNEAAPGSTANPIAAVAAGSGFKVAGAGEMKNGEALAFRLPDQSSGIVFVTNAGELRALSAKCTHAGCIVEWQKGDDLIKCPCHGSRFDTAGQVLGGPATKPLARFKAIRQGSDALITTVL
jgi:cytochrome b6-f complex iron-sulfur subunit